MKNRKKTNDKQNKILKLILIKSHFNKKNILKKDNLKHIKPALRIIHKCHINNKKILFVGMPFSYSYKIKNSNHMYIPESIWVKGILTNSKQVSEYLRKKKHRKIKNKKIQIKNSKFLLNLTKKPDLIVILNKSTDTEALNEGYLTRIPVVTLSPKSLPIKDFKSSYKIPTNLLTESNQNIFIPFIVSILKKNTKHSLKKKLMYKKRRLVFSKNRKKYNVSK